MNEQNSNTKEPNTTIVRKLRIRRQKHKIWHEPNLVVSHAPHTLNKQTVANTMWTVSLALIPAFIWGVLRYTFNLKINLFSSAPLFTYETTSSNFFLIDMLLNDAFLTVLTAILCCVITEAVILFLQGKKIRIFDGSAFLTGLLLGMSLPAKRPFIVIIVSSIFAILLIKHLFGGLGKNFINPAIAGRLFAMSSWPSLLYRQEIYSYSSAELNTSIQSLNHMDGLTGATPLSLIRQIQTHPDFQSALEPSTITTSTLIPNMPIPEVDPSLIKDQVQTFLSQSIPDLIIGNTSGCIGELSSLLLLLGGLFLIWKRCITASIPLSYLATFFMLCLIGQNPFGESNLWFALYHLFSGSLILGAFFIATDPVSSPITQRGKIILGIFLGILTYVIRIYGGYPEGVGFAILIGNFLNPLLNKFCVPRIYGHPKNKIYNYLLNKMQFISDKSKLKGNLS